MRWLKSVCLGVVLICANAKASTPDILADMQATKVSASALANDFREADALRSSALPAPIAARGRIWDALVLRGDEDLDSALHATEGVSFIGRSLFETITSDGLSKGYVPEVVRAATDANTWEERVIANLLVARASTFRQDNVEAFTAAWAALDAISQDDRSLSAEAARIEAFSYLVALHTMSRDTAGAVKAARRQEDVERRSGLHGDHVTTLYNIAMVFAANGERSTAENLLETARSLPEAAEPMNAVRLDYALGKILTQEDRHAEAVPLLASAVDRLSGMEADHAMLEASANLRLALAHSHEGRADAARIALDTSRSIKLDPSIRERAAPLETLTLANIDMAEGRVREAAQSYRDHIAFMNKNEAALIRRERSDGMRAVTLSEALYDARTEAAEARAEAAEVVAAKARERMHMAVVGALIALLASAFSLWQYRRAVSARARADESRALEAQHRLRAEESEKVARFARDAAQEAERRAVQGEQAKEDFLAMMGHETRTPLNGLLPTLEFIETKLENAELLALVKIARLSANNLAAMLDNVSVLTAHRAGHLPNDPEIQPVGKLVAARVDEFRDNSGDVGLQFLFRDTTEGKAYAVDERKLVKCVDALLDNASRFTGQGTVAVLVQPDTDGGFRVAVSDDGPGMDPSTVGRLLRPFEQADKSRTRSKDGLGIGLAVVDTLTDVMGGKMTIRTKPNQGTTVLLEVPRAEPMEKPTPRRTDKRHALQAERAPRPAGPPSLRVVA